MLFLFSLTESETMMSSIMSSAIIIMNPTLEQLNGKV